MTLIDTSCWIEFFRRTGDATVKAKVAGYIDLGEAAYCGPIRFELLLGARKREIPSIHQAFGFSELLDFPVSCWDLAAQMGNVLRRKGISAPRDDLFIAAAACYHGVPLYANDTHFTLIKDHAAPQLNLV